MMITVTVSGSVRPNRFDVCTVLYFVVGGPLMSVQRSKASGKVAITLRVMSGAELGHIKPIVIVRTKCSTDNRTIRTTLAFDSDSPQRRSSRGAITATLETQSCPFKTRTPLNLPGYLFAFPENSANSFRRTTSNPTRTP